MTVHIGAENGDIAETILLPGDPMRAKHIAETMFDDVVCYTKVRGMLGFTGTYNGKRVSVQGTGMGMPSHSIYVHELINDYGVKKLIRVGSCGAFQPEIKINDVVLGMSASTNSAMNKLIFSQMDYAPTADFSLLYKAYQAAVEKDIKVHVGKIYSGDSFYSDNHEGWKLWAKYGILAVEMEAAALYTIAARFGVKALTVLTVSDSAVTGEKTSSEDREKTITQMVDIALAAAL